MWLAYYKCHPNVLNFGAYINANPYLADESGYYYEYYGQGSMETTVGNYIAAMQKEGYRLNDTYDSNGAIHYILEKNGYVVYVTDDYLLEHIEIHIE